MNGAPFAERLGRLTVAAIVSFCGLTLAQAPPKGEKPVASVDAKALFVELHEATKRIENQSEKLTKLDKTVPKRAEKARMDVVYLEKANKAIPMPQDYLETLQNDLYLLRDIRLDESAERDVELFKAATTDLDAKVKTAEAQKKDPYRVNVSVTTIDTKKKEVHGLDVLFVQKGFENNEKRARPFPKRSSPTERPFLPGNWVFWSQDPDDAKKKGPKKSVSVISSDKEPLQIEIGTPK